MYHLPSGRQLRNSAHRPHLVIPLVGCSDVKFTSPVSGEIFFYPNSHQREISIFPYLRWLPQALLAQNSVELRICCGPYPSSAVYVAQVARSRALPLHGHGGGSCSSRGDRPVGLPWTPSSSYPRSAKPSQLIEAARARSSHARLPCPC